jgi:hypothetical protein
MKLTARLGLSIAGERIAELGHKRRLCDRGQHDWQPCEIRYEQGKTMAYLGDSCKKTKVNVTWVNDEICSVCGCESWWPA